MTTSAMPDCLRVLGGELDRLHGQMHERMRTEKGERSGRGADREVVFHWLMSRFDTKTKALTDLVNGPLIRQVACGKGRAAAMYRLGRRLEKILMKMVVLRNTACALRVEPSEAHVKSLVVEGMEDVLCQVEGWLGRQTRVLACVARFAGSVASCRDVMLELRLENMAGKSAASRERESLRSDAVPVPETMTSGRPLARDGFWIMVGVFVLGCLLGGSSDA